MGIRLERKVKNSHPIINPPGSVPSITYGASSGMDPPYHLPDDFLSLPSPIIQKQIIDFKKTDLPDYDGYFACILDNVLSADECAELIRAVKAQTNGEWEQATIKVGFGMQEVDPESRLCGRIIWDNKDLASRIWARCRDHVPEILELKDRPEITGGGHLMKDWTFRPIGLNDSMRFLRYFDGNYFRRKIAVDRQLR